MYSAYYQQIKSFSDRIGKFESIIREASNRQKLLKTSRNDLKNQVIQLKVIF
jgi:predicted  nucleic acid-binding Zn-ribbon protein